MKVLHGCCWRTCCRLFNLHRQHYCWLQHWSQRFLPDKSSIISCDRMLAPWSGYLVLKVLWVLCPNLTDAFIFFFLWMTQPTLERQPRIMNAVRNDFLFHFPLLTAPSLVFSSSIELGSSYKITEENSCLSDFDEFILITRSPSCPWSSSFDAPARIQKTRSSFVPGGNIPRVETKGR